jgi:hypothetical protein
MCSCLILPVTGLELHRKIVKENERSKLKGTGIKFESGAQFYIRNLF